MNIYFVDFESDLVVDVTSDVKKMKNKVCVPVEEIVQWLFEGTHYDDVIFAKDTSELERRLSLALYIRQRREQVV